MNKQALKAIVGVLLIMVGMPLLIADLRLLSLIIVAIGGFCIHSSLQK